jgi:hypothetical protein
MTCAPIPANDNGVVTNAAWRRDRLAPSIFDGSYCLDRNHAD